MTWAGNEREGWGSEEKSEYFNADDFCAKHRIDEFAAYGDNT